MSTSTHAHGGRPLSLLLSSHADSVFPFGDAPIAVLLNPAPNSVLAVHPRTPATPGGASLSTSSLWVSNSVTRPTASSLCIVWTRPNTPTTTGAVRLSREDAEGPVTPLALAISALTALSLSGNRVLRMS